MKKNKALIKIIIAVLLFKCSYIKAIEVGSETNGKTVEIHSDACGSSDEEGCFGYTENLIVRISLVDQNGNLVVGWNGEPTKTVQFTAGSLGAGRRMSPTIEKTIPKFIGLSDNSSYGTSDANGEITEFHFSGSSIVGTEGTDTDVYNIYMGFNPYDGDDFAHYQSNRDAFVNYAMSLSTRDKNILVFKNDEPKLINFLEFFLNVCGFTNEWEINGNQEMLKKLVENDYYLLIEPVFSYWQKANGKWYGVEGTAKQIGNFAKNGDNLAYAEDLNLAYMANLSYNYFCSFIEESGNLNITTEHEYLCGSTDYFNYYDTNTDTYSTERKNAAYDTCISDCVAEKANKCNNRTVRDSSCSTPCSTTCSKKFGGPLIYDDYEISYETFNIGNAANNYLVLSWNNTAEGVNLISLKNIISAQKIKNECNINVNSCADGDFKYSIKLATNNTDGLFHCVYPSDTFNMKKELENFIYHDTASDLWCYDNMTYDFSQIKSKTARKKYDKNQLEILPSGTLTIERTCFSKRDNSGGVATSLDNIFKSDSITDNYQKEFYIYFNGENIPLTRGEKEQKEIDETGKSYQKEELTTSYGEKYYRYKSTFTYPYYYKNGYNPKTISVNISDFNITESVGNTNAIDIPISGFDDYARALRIREKTPLGESINQLNTEKFDKGVSQELTKGYGISQNLYETISKDRKTTEEEKNTKFTNGITYTSSSARERESDGMMIITESEMTYNYTQKNGLACNYSTTITDNDPFGDGIQFRVISLSNPFPARDGTSRLAGTNWLNDTENYVHTYIIDNRGAYIRNEVDSSERVYELEPLYTLTLDAETMIKIREYNKTHTYADIDLTCEKGKGRMCISSFLRNKTILPNVEGKCAGVTSEETYIKASKAQFKNSSFAIYFTIDCDKTGKSTKGTCTFRPELDIDQDGVITMKDHDKFLEYVDEGIIIDPGKTASSTGWGADYLVPSSLLGMAEYYNCADKTATSGG